MSEKRAKSVLYDLKDQDSLNPQNLNMVKDRSERPDAPFEQRFEHRVVR